MILGEILGTPEKKVEWPKTSPTTYYGGESTYKDWSKWVKSNPADIPDYVLDIVYSTWSGSSKIAERPVVDSVLKKIYDKNGYFQPAEFKKAVFKGLSQRYIGIFGFLGVQAVLFAVFIGPAFVEFFEM